MFREPDDPLLNLDILTSPVIFHERRNPSEDFEWAAGIMAAPSFPEFDMAGLAFADLKGALDGMKSAAGAAAPAPAYPIPVLAPQRMLPKAKRFRSAVPCVFRPFTSFAATELAVSQLRASLRDSGAPATESHT
jgi:hypothetical protein